MTLFPLELPILSNEELSFSSVILDSLKLLSIFLLCTPFCFAIISTDKFSLSSVLSYELYLLLYSGSLGVLFCYYCIDKFKGTDLFLYGAISIIYEDPSLLVWILLLFGELRLARRSAAGLEIIGFIDPINNLYLFVDLVVLLLWSWLN